MIIRKINPASRVSETAGLTERLIEAHKNSNLSADIALEELFAELKVEYAEIIASLTGDTAQSEMDERDIKRDNSFKGIGYFLKGYLNHDDVVLVSSAKKIYSIYENYGAKILDLPYVAENAEINSFLKDLKDEDVASEAEVLPGFSSFIDALELNQKRFDTALYRWEESKTANKLSESASAIKKRIFTTVNTKIITYVRAMMVISAPKYTHFVTKLAEIIDANNITVNKRKSGGEEK